MSPGDRDFLCQPTQRSYRQPPWLFLQTLVPPACFRLADVLWYVAPARSTTSCPRSVRLLYVLEASVRASSSKSDIGNNFPSLMLIMALMKRSSGSKYNAHSAPSTRSRQTCIRPLGSNTWGFAYAIRLRVCLISRQGLRSACPCRLVRVHNGLPSSLSGSTRNQTMRRHSKPPESNSTAG